MSTVKVLRNAAFRLESCNTPLAWGVRPPSPTTGDCFPYLSLGAKKVIAHEQDASISSYGFQDTARLVGSYVEDSLSTYLRSAGIEPLLFWAFGYEHAPVVVCVITTSSTGTFVLGDTYEDSDNSEFLLIRDELLKSGAHQYVFKCIDGLAIASESSLNRTAGTGVSEIVVVTDSGILYEHLFTLDAKDRSSEDYRTEGVGRYDPNVGETSELGPDNPNGNALSEGDKKCRRATIGLALGTGDFIYPGAMCKKFEISSEAGKLTSISADYVAFAELSSANASTLWTPNSYLVTNDNVLGHHDFQVRVAGSDSNSNDTLGVTSFNLGADIPIKIEQDTESNLSIAEPVFEGTYGLTSTIELSRHSSAVFETIRDNWTQVCAAIEAYVGSSKFGIYIESANISESGPNEDMVAKEQLNLVIGFSDTDVFTNSLYSYKNFQGSPILCLVRNARAAQMTNLY